MAGLEVDALGTTLNWGYSCNVVYVFNCNSIEELTPIT
jgi:hypothetical protein